MVGRFPSSGGGGIVRVVVVPSDGAHERNWDPHGIGGTAERSDADHVCGWIAADGGGIGSGIICRWAVRQLIRSLLFGVQPLDWNVFASVLVMVVVIAMGACAYPAWRAASVDPMTALRCE
jgi:hypothetical protein